MKILFLAPEPFYQERGTPIAVRLALQVLSQRSGEEIDLLVYHEGENVKIPGVNVHRIRAPWWLSGIGPGISFRKLLCDVIFLFTALGMVIKAGPGTYRLVHAVEESVFIAWLIKLIWRIPYIYDMDSSLSLQVAEKWRILRPVKPLLSFIERLAVRNSLAVVPVCDTLAALAKSHGSRMTEVLSDISLLDEKPAEGTPINLRQEAGIDSTSVLLLYIGNLEHYQGIDLLVESFAVAAKDAAEARLVIVGGRKEHVDFYQAKAEGYGIADRVKLLGPRAVERLSDYLRQADILVSPRIQGNNTPMKVYSYLHSGIPVLATDLPTHTQVLTAEVSKLAQAEPLKFGKAMLELIRDQAERSRIGNAARKLAEERYTFSVFKNKLNSIYDRVADSLTTSPPSFS